MAISISERATALQRAKRALKRLHEHPGTSRERLGAARDQLNLIYTLAAATEVWDAVMAIETSVLEVYGGIPAKDRQAQHRPNNTN